MPQLRTSRLLLRPWQEGDLEPFAQINADPRVMQYFPSTLTHQESDQRVRTYMEDFSQYGWGLWAVELQDTKQFIGFIGLRWVEYFTAHFTPAVEIGWRLAYDFWGKGYATEGAKASLDYGFQKIGLQEIVAFTAVPNRRSQAVMQRLDMTHDPKDDFDHPGLPEGHWLRRHVLYRKKPN